MNLGYTLPNAELLIKTGKKIHTLREDKKDKWKEGMKIHHCTGIRTRKYRCFKQDTARGIQRVVIRFEKQLDLFNSSPVVIYVDGLKLSMEDMVRLAQNDGFDGLKTFLKYFFKAKGRKVWSGKIIHFTHLKYRGTVTSC